MNLFCINVGFLEVRLIYYCVCIGSRADVRLIVEWVELCLDVGRQPAVNPGFLEQWVSTGAERGPLSACTGILG